MAQPSQVPPPQSTSVSATLVTPSLQWLFCPHTRLLQSEPTSHSRSSSHGLHTGPPQSKSVSSPFFLPSVQSAGTHSCVAVSQAGASAGQSMSPRHFTQALLPSHSL